ncbi:hypothetical protein FCIRC_7299 [Fusarium circinatum]|uniref:Uncharacterized protein n=1 Tax=Fusarium circinatum TaxID=48490 RepID=A0A8H5TNX2_FUSCI|nr:hypothetical protein FCIRC_7299 [Fusarium circinatum]
MVGQVKAKDKSDDYHSDSESEADDILFTGVCRSERARQLLRLIDHLEQADSSGHAEVISKLKEKKVQIAWILGLSMEMPETNKEERWLTSWDGREGNVIGWITNNIANWSETMGEGEKKRLIDEGNHLMEEDSKDALKLAKERKMTHLEDATETVDAASGQTTEVNDLSQANKVSKCGTIKTEPSQPVAQIGRPEHIAGTHANSKRKNKPTTSLNQQDHELPPATEVSETDEAWHVRQKRLDPVGYRRCERAWNEFRDYHRRQNMLMSSLNQQDDQPSPPSNLTHQAGEQITQQHVHSNPALDDDKWKPPTQFGDWYHQRHAIRRRDERIVRQRGYGIKWSGEKAHLFPLDKAVRRADEEKAKTMGKKVRWELDGAKFE